MPEFVRLASKHAIFVRNQTATEAGKLNSDPALTPRLGITEEKEEEKEEAEEEEEEEKE